jgi:hypothetical protein
MKTQSTAGALQPGGYDPAAAGWPSRAQHARVGGTRSVASFRGFSKAIRLHGLDNHWDQDMMLLQEVKGL